MSATPPKPKYPEVAAFIRKVMQQLGASNPTELAERLGWTDASEIRKLYKWHAGAQSPNYESTIGLLHAAKMLRERGSKVVVQPSPPGRPDPVLDRLELLQETVVQVGEGIATLQAAIDRLAIADTPAVQRASRNAPRKR